MKVVILCGGKGTRLGDQTKVKPKPLVEIDDKVILWHIMKTYSQYGYNDFILCLGYKGEMIKSYFEKQNEFNITFLDTGIETGTAIRLQQVSSLTSDLFFMTYGDGLSNINIKELLNFHRKHGKIATVTAVRPLVRFGLLGLEENQVISFSKHRIPTQGRIDGGFFVFDKRIFSYLKDYPNNQMLEGEPLQILASDGELMAFRHDDYWHCIDTPRDLEQAKSDLKSTKNWMIKS